jgi:hypothetical protein
LKVALIIPAHGVWSDGMGKNLVIITIKKYVKLIANIEIHLD